MPTKQFGYMKETEDGKRMYTHLTELQNYNEDFINWYKNHQLIKLFLESKKCNWIWNGFWGIPAEYIEPNRFDGDYHNFIDNGVDNSHPGPLHNKEYAKKLKNYIQDNFPHYLPNDSESYNTKLF
jgi:tRNA splicing ligase